MEDDADLEHDEIDAETEQEEGCTCGGCCSHEPCGRCMECLGLSWRDFF